MEIKKRTWLFVLCCISVVSYAQTARIKGVILDANNKPVVGANISCLAKQTQSNSEGFYQIDIPSEKKVTLIFTHIALKKASLVVNLSPNELQEFNLVMDNKQEQIGEIIIEAKKRKVQGITVVDPEIIKKIPGANPGIESVLKTLPGVNSNNELSSQYSVRGGSYDENLVYVNEIEIYRPFLVRSGQQEGLSFTNTDLIQNVAFSAGGFQAKYGDKLSSVLDITYRKPKINGATLEASFLGGSLSVDGVSNNKKWSAITGVRYRNNSLLVNSQDTQTNFTPRFTDIQTNIIYDASTKWQWSFLGNLSQNRYLYQPLSRLARIGRGDNPIEIAINYEGRENDKYDTYFGAFKTSFKANEKWTFKLISSIFHTLEQEYFDISSQYQFANIDENIETNSFLDTPLKTEFASEFNHARNDLDALIANIELKGKYNRKKDLIEWGVKYTSESIRDRLSEWQLIDSVGFSINPPIKGLPVKDQPYSVFTGPLLPFQSVSATNYNTINRFSGYAQWTRRETIGKAAIELNLGGRVQSWQVQGAIENGQSQTVFSPRGQITIKPNKEKEIVYRASGGIYYQPPFYRELRGVDGVVRPNVKAQQSAQIVIANEADFKLWGRPFKLVSEIYYKSLKDVNTYTIDNVRTRYVANNDAVAYAQGLDLRINGEFVPGTESWLSFGYLKTEENSNNRGYIARPTDQRLKFGILFQDYMPNVPSVKLYLNLVYNTGVPGGSPSYSDPYLFQNRLKDYRRADIGFSKVLVDSNLENNKNNWLRNFKELAIGLEIFNLFNNQNAITNTWVRDVYAKNQIAIPNYLTNRVFNIKINARL